MRQKKVRLATIRLGDLWAMGPKQANPFADDFSMQAAVNLLHDRLDVYRRFLQRAGDMGCDLVVTQEDMAGISSFMTFLDDPGLFQKLVSVSSSAAAEFVSSLARRYRMHIVSCYYEKQGRGIYNVATLWDRRGAVIGKYRKVHLPVYETWLVRPGNSFPAFKTDIGKVAMTICYDQMWPESVAACALNGAEIVCMPSAATPDDFRAQTRALDNQVFFITSTPGTCVIVAPNGTILTRTGEKPREVVHADANVHGATLARKNFFEYLYSGIQDHKERHLKLRRPRAYAPITCPAPALMKDYPKGGLAINPRDIRRVYEAHKQETQRRLRGEKGHYDWRW